MRFCFIVLLLVILPCRASADAVTSIPGCTFVPTEWADGDSFLVRLPDGGEQTVRIYGADCLEWHVNDEKDARRLSAQRRYFGITGGTSQESIARAKAFGEAAAKRTRELLAKPFTLSTSFADGRGDAKYHRIYGFVTTADGRDLASELVREGLARAYGVTRSLPDGTSAVEYRKRLEDLELTAANAGRGVWMATDWSRLTSDREAERREEEELASAIAKPLPAAGLDPNIASRDELMSLPGIGEALSARIIEARADGPYSGPDDLLRVRGISKNLLQSLAPHLSFPQR